ncbi:kinetochore protein Mis13 [Schizosaccharomyces japonicus yFS275]|uniref:Kinetochore protein Mis13 n=1 Tax=Schizosaccharomyces japonicus (strain yFS275 / FY16936) TaxID=402676 RepID=B6K279_SCHJY|nr:kinetochore protein Mis13 [Schizosaccharomyces japonicus yFS275]EEB07260.1 kinetochore protein Mis13 [Schizosaccharomyces japonicus yFS275]
MKRKAEEQEGFVFVRKRRETVAVTSKESESIKIASQTPNGAKEQKNEEVIIALPENDTPVIAKNQKLRKASERRSSLSQRGKRASSIGLGFEALPHADVPTSEYHRHISADLSEPLRMKQLIIWSGSNSLDEQRRNYAETKESSEAAIARSIVREVLNDLVAGKFDVSWYQRPPGSVIPTKPHPQNIRNHQLVDELSVKLKKLKEEEAAWRAIFSSSANSSMFALPETKSVQNNADNGDAIEDEVSSSNQYASQMNERLNEVEERAMIAVDTLSSQVHTIQSLTQLGRQYGENVMNKMARQYANHLTEVQSLRSQTDDASILRSISRIENE